MLPAANRLRRSADFTTTVRTGSRVRRGNVVLHQHRSFAAAESPALVGFVVGRSVGGSVVRHRTARRLRAVVASRIATLPAGSATVVRALPGAGIAASAALASDIDQALVALERRA